MTIQLPSHRKTHASVSLESQHDKNPDLNILPLQIVYDSQVLSLKIQDCQDLTVSGRGCAPSSISCLGTVNQFPTQLLGRGLGRRGTGFLPSGSTGNDTKLGCTMDLGRSLSNPGGQATSWK